ncbi:circadian associated repressor of transcription a isoform X2 [Silurus meridionalis]|nr:circadian associated repressor of transcription a isoform X2 [Silurus meridionalis]KAI5105675.1 hypothetical protein C0J45_3372 [Silurus meridionalis]
MQSIESASSQASPDSLTFGDEDSEVFLSEDERSEVTGGPSRSALSSCSPALVWSSTEREHEKENKTLGGTPGDLQFAQKCLALQGFIRPLLELLTGLKKGRFDKGLSSFQQSVAMDRIRRIVGLLQKPHIGEKYLRTLLQVEMMLKLWFPQVSLQLLGTRVSTHHTAPSSSSSSMPPHKRKDQLHIPVKKRRLRWTDPCSSPTPSLTPVPCKCFHIKGQENAEPSPGLSPSSALARHPEQSECVSKEKSGSEVLHGAEPGLTWIHVAPIFSPPMSCPSLTVREGGAKDMRNSPLLPPPSPPGSRCSPATQDNSITSTTPCSEPETQIQTEGRSPSQPITEQLLKRLQT